MKHQLIKIRTAGVATYRLTIGFIPLLLAGCLGMPDKVQPVSEFQLDRYLGKWFEIARLDHSFERGLNQVTAEYSMRDDGGVRVLNRGFDPGKDKWKESEGRAFFVDDETVGYLKVSFFGPFYGSYIVFELDQDDYQYALVAGPDTSYLWILSRTPTVSDELMDKLLQKARESGFDPTELIMVEQS